MVARGIPEGGTVGAAASAVCDRVWCRAHARTACVDLCPDGGLGHLCDHDSGGLTVLRRLPGRRADRPPGPRQLQGSGRSDVLPPATAFAAAPATFNTINKWAAGISDTLALGLLNEAIGLGLPIVAVPWPNAALARHPA